MQKTGAQKFLEMFGYFMMGVLILVGIGMIWLGAREYSIASRFPKPEPISIEELIRRQPADGWYRITGAALDLRQSAWEEEVGTGTINRSFVPLRSTRNPGDPKIHVLVDTHNSEIVAVVQRLRAAGKDDRRPAGFAPGVPRSIGDEANLWLPRPVEGMVSYSGQGGVIASRLKSANLNLYNSLAPGYIYLNEGKSPQLSAVATLVIMGIVVIGVTVLAMVKSIRESRAIRVG